MSHVQACEFALANQHPDDAESARVTALTFARMADREAQRKATVTEAIYTLRQAPYGSLSDGEVVALIEILSEQLVSADTDDAFRFLGGRMQGSSLEIETLIGLLEKSDEIQPEPDYDIFTRVAA